MCGVEAFAVHRCAVPRYFAGRLGEVTVDNIMQIRSWAVLTVVKPPAVALLLWGQVWATKSPTTTLEYSHSLSLDMRKSVIEYVTAAYQFNLRVHYSIESTGQSTKESKFVPIRNGAR
ncbi:hypothetical protein MGG_00585 [Pyricularia oryzae 70-15]|uniref:Uncharacterized protein n=3 Tax=Pyricularia oryzae TaxID=318829 RepID=G4NBB1_PYRO7|nr:uncharacterized protein MGG_00585 [Pyricularia oryzae 70-15]EHA48873.1 hypothetical protein MGG_00585 [Pyricularia oryzae 70-15]ELQ38774.1 hypothetical protein OOU_Y34scaffold00528g66 [Pyricularia oryzae Y34]